MLTPHISEILNYCNSVGRGPIYESYSEVPTGLPDEQSGAYYSAACGVDAFVKHLNSSLALRLTYRRFFIFLQYEQTKEHISNLYKKNVKVRLAESIAQRQCDKYWIARI